MDILTILISIGVGSIIGFITNFFAILMLFKPHTRWSILKIPLPFTPGVIPRNREKIARNVGNVVGETLLNEESIKEKLYSDNLQSHIHNTLYDIYVRVFNRSADSFFSLIPEELKSLFKQIIVHLKSYLSREISIYINSENFKKFFKEVCSKNIGYYLEQNMDELFDRTSIIHSIRDRVDYISNSSSVKQKIRDFVDYNIEKISSSDNTIRDIISENIVSLIKVSISKQIPVLINFVTDYLQNVEIRKSLSKTVQNILFDYIAKLNTIEKFIANLTGAETRIKKDVPLLLDDLVKNLSSLLEKGESYSALENLIDENIDKLLEKKLIDLKWISSYSEDKQAAFEFLYSSVTKWINDDSTQEFLIDKAMSVLENNEKRSLKSIINTFYENGHEKIIKLICDNLLSSIRKEQTLSSITAFIDEKVDYYIYEKPVNSLNTYLPDNITKLIENKGILFIRNKLSLFIDNNLSKFLLTINIKLLVEERINAFPMSEVEKMILTVVKKHLKWINIFGAILGALIGFLQVIINYYRG